ncbi:Protein of unknown function [Bacillus wiedmannii]|nr:Protein of unknown function [Bacillus wiedmannii]
MKNFTKGIYP